MANHASAIKRVRQNIKRRSRNKAIRTQAKNIIKHVRKLLANGDVDRASNALPKAMSILDTAVIKGVIHSNKASRNISRLSNQIYLLKA